MAPKRAEERVRNLLKGYGWGWHKYGDVRYCIHCHRVLPKSEKAPDFSAWMVYTWVEAKNSDSSGKWKCSEILPGGERSNQRAWLAENGGWLFIELGEGVAPKGKSAYLVPFDQWVGQIEPQLAEAGMSSIRKETYRNRPGADQLLAEYRLTWEGGTWIVPDNHVWWQVLYTVMSVELSKVKAHLH